jgi:Zn-dependent peptidase ImmA (M78 family)
MEWARESSGVTQRDAADHVGQPVETVAAWEAGHTQPTLGALQTLAKLYRRPLAAFLLPEPPSEPPLPVDFRVRHGRAQTPLDRGTLASIRWARRLQALVSDLDGGHWLLAPFDAGSVREAADAERHRLGATSAVRRNWTSNREALNWWRGAIGSAGVMVLQADLPVDEVRAYSLPGTRPAIVLNEHDAVAARSFSLIHELGHLRLGAGAVCSPPSLLADGADGSEALCDDFAESVLVPRDELLGMLDDATRAAGATEALLERLAAEFRVSRQVIWYRLLDVGMISAAQFSAQWEAWEKAGPPRRTRDSQPKIARWQKAAWRLGPRMVSRLLQAEAQNELSTSEMLGYLDVPLESVERLSEAIARQ